MRMMMKNQNHKKDAVHCVRHFSLDNIMAPHFYVGLNASKCKPENVIEKTTS